MLHGVAALAATPLSLGEALARLEADNPTLQAERYGVERATAQLTEAQGKRWPGVTVAGAYARVDSRIGLSLEPLQQALAPSFPAIAGALPDTLMTRPFQFTTVGTNILWPIYTGHRVSAGIRAAQAARQASDAQRAGTAGSLRLELVRRYFGQRLAEEIVTVRQATLASLDRHVADARKLEREGMITRAERLRAEVAQAEASRDLDEARGGLALAQAGLSALLATEQPFELTTPVPQPPPQTAPPLDELQREAREHNPQLQAAAHQAERARAGVRAAQGERLPTVALFAHRNLYHHDSGPASVLYSPGWVVGVGMRWELFDGFQQRAKVAAAVAQANEVQARQAAGERDIGLLVQQRRQAWLTAQAKLQSLGTTSELAEESLRAQQLAFEENLASSLDVVDAELALSRVRLGLLAARYDATLALAGLYEVTGNSARIAELASPRHDPRRP